MGLALGVVALALPACRPLYLPPVPASRAAPAIAQLGDASALAVSGDALVLHVVLVAIPEAGWLDVQWFAPDGAEAASDSTWVVPADVGQGRTFRSPARVRVTAGEWRAVVSLRGRVLRQFRTVVPAAPGG